MILCCYIYVMLPDRLARVSSPNQVIWSHHLLSQERPLQSQDWEVSCSDWGRWDWRIWPWGSWKAWGNPGLLISGPTFPSPLSLQILFFGAMRLAPWISSWRKGRGRVLWIVRIRGAVMRRMKLSKPMGPRRYPDQSIEIYDSFLHGPTNQFIFHPHFTS